MLVEKSFDTGEVVLNYAEGTDNGPPLVLLPGGTQRWQSEYLPIISLTKQRWRVYALDHRGHGKSGRVPGKYRMKDYASDVVSFLEHLDEPTVLFGHSMGGMIAEGVAAQISDKLLALILADPPITNESSYRWIEADFFQTWSKAMIKIIKEGGSVREIASKLEDGHIKPSSLERARTLSELDVGVFGAFTRLDETMEDYDMDSMLGQISCPVLLIQADDVGMGHAMTDKDVEYALSILTDVSHVKIEGVWHGLGFEAGHTNPDVMNAIMDFLESIR
jgi:pimeloyl-ACP methyl ester carboxylesterase